MTSTQTNTFYKPYIKDRSPINKDYLDVLERRKITLSRTKLDRLRTPLSFRGSTKLDPAKSKVMLGVEWEMFHAYPNTKRFDKAIYEHPTLKHYLNVTCDMGDAELITPPMTLGAHNKIANKHVFNGKIYDTFIEKSKKYNSTQWLERVGIHVHIDKDAFNDRSLTKFLTFFGNVDNWDFLAKVSGRNEKKEDYVPWFLQRYQQSHPFVKGKNFYRYSGYNRPVYVYIERDKHGKPLNKPPKNLEVKINRQLCYNTLLDGDSFFKLYEGATVTYESRSNPLAYPDCSCTNVATAFTRGTWVNATLSKGTVEVRMFATTKKLSEYLKNLEFCDALTRYCRISSYCNLTVEKFTEYLLKKQDKYPNLVSYLQL